MTKCLRGIAKDLFTTGFMLAYVTHLFAAVPANQLFITSGSLSERETAIFVAKDYGLFAKNGLDVRPMVHVRNGNVALSALVSNRRSPVLYGRGHRLEEDARRHRHRHGCGFCHQFDSHLGRNLRCPASNQNRGGAERQEHRCHGTGGGVWMRSMLAFEYWGLEQQRDKIVFFAL